MSFILNIDTAVETASVCLAENETAIGIKINPSTKDTASWVHGAIKELLEENSSVLSQLNAVAISEGPGSYTGLRVGMATAKGLCYVLKIPLITINTLQMMAAAADNVEADLLCPMIDARRMEVFTALFRKDLEQIEPSSNLILDASSFIDHLNKSTIAFFGNGSKKFQSITHHPHAFFKNVEATAANMISLSFKKYFADDFSSLAYAEPNYGKDFHSTARNL